MSAKYTLIVLPGWGGSETTWKDFAALASQDFDVHIINLPCFGDEPCPDEVWGVGEYAHFAAEKIALVAAHQPVILLGHSFGGAVAARVASEQLTRINGLVLSGAAVFRPRRRLRRLVLGTVAKVGKKIFSLPLLERFSPTVQRLFYRGIDSPDYLSTSGVKRDIFTRIIREDATHLLPSIAVPTLVVWSARDRFIPVSDGKKIARLIRGAQLHIIPHGTHGLHITAPDALCNTIRTWASSYVTLPR